jgi:hypothetical protein
MKDLKPGTYTIKSGDLEFDGKGQPRLKPDANPIPTIPRKARSMKHIRKDPLEDHPRAAETRRMMIEARIDDEQEVMDLQSSELACDIADAWVKHPTSWDLGHKIGISKEFARTLDRLELITRPSAMRKVRP